MEILVEICGGTHCAMMGALNLGTMIEDVAEEMEDQLKVKYVKCFQHAEGAGEQEHVMVKVNGEPVYSASAEVVFEKIMDLIQRDREVMNQ